MLVKSQKTIDLGTQLTFIGLNHSIIQNRLVVTGVIVDVVRCT
jgi:hypothetical protein